MPAARLVLASTSPYRRDLLSRLRMPFDVLAPRVDETPLPGEAPVQLARRLAIEKARVVAASQPSAVVIGSDQVADLDGRCIGKPGNHAAATGQLQAMSGRTVLFHTALSVQALERGFSESAVVSVTVRFRTLANAEIERYLRAETPYDCAGSAKCETLGIALLEAIESDDPTALVGLPLIETCRLLRQAGVDPLGAPAPR